MQGDIGTFQGKQELRLVTLGCCNLPKINKKADYPNIYNINAIDGMINKVGDTIGRVIKLEVKPGEAACEILKQQPEQAIVAALPMPIVQAETDSLVGDSLYCMDKQHVLRDVIQALKANPGIVNKQI